MHPLIRQITLATLACVCLTRSASAGIYFASSGTPSVATIDSSPVYSGPNVNFIGYGFTAGAVMNQSLLSAGTTLLTFAYEGVDYGFGLRPVMNVTNDTGFLINSITFALGSVNTSFYGFATTGATSATPSGAVVNMSTSYAAVNPFTIPLNLAPGATIGIYVPVNVPSIQGEFSLLQTINIGTAVPEPSTVGSLALGLVASGAFAARRRSRRV